MEQLSHGLAGSALRHRLVEDMTVRRFSDKTRKYYIRIVAAFANFLERPPQRRLKKLCRFQVHQASLGMGAPAMNCTVAALRFFFTHILDPPDLAASSSAFRIRANYRLCWRPAR